MNIFVKDGKIVMPQLQDTHSFIRGVASCIEIGGHTTHNNFYPRELTDPGRFSPQKYWTEIGGYIRIAITNRNNYR